MKEFFNMVSNYKPNKCKYSIGRLDNVIYLISENAVKDIHIDDGVAYVDDIVQAPIAIKAHDIEFSDVDELDERYKFTHSLTFTVNGYLNHNDFQGRYFAIIKSVEGVYWLCNAMFPSKVTYTYTLNANGSQTRITMAIVSNHPTLMVSGMTQSTPYDCGYVRSTFKNLRLNETRYSTHRDNIIDYSNDGFKEIDYNAKSATFTETFDGNAVQHNITFSIGFGNYKSSWHYNLLEFVDNKYCGVIETSDGKFILTGFLHGLQPSFSVSANDDMEFDKIEIQLNDNHDSGDLITVYDNIIELQNLETTYEFTTDFNGYECVGNGIARYLLKKEVDVFGNPTGKFKCLEGYESTFSNLGDNLVGTFDETEQFANPSCGINICEMNTSLPNSIEFNDASSKQFTVESNGTWTLTSSNNGITVSPSSGVGNTSYIVNVSNSIPPSNIGVTATLALTYCNMTKVTQVMVIKGNCFPSGKQFSLDANEQYLNIPTSCCVQSVSDTSSTITNIAIQDGFVRVLVPQNQSSARTITLLFTFCDGSSDNVTITQSTIYERWVDEGYVCDGNNKCTIQRKYTGTTPYLVDTWTVETRTVNCSANADCGGIMTRWVDTENTYCGGDYEFYVQKEQTSIDGGTTWVDSGYERLGAETEDSPSSCSGASFINRWIITERTTCIGFDKYKLYQRQINDNGWRNAVPTDLSYNANGIKNPQLVQSASTDCGYVAPITPLYKWLPSDGYICDVDDGKQYRWQTTYSYCNGANKMAYQQRMVSTDGGTTWSNVTPQETQTIVLEYDSSECE